MPGQSEVSSRPFTDGLGGTGDLSTGRVEVPISGETVAIEAPLDVAPTVCVTSDRDSNAVILSCKGEAVMRVSAIWPSGMSTPPGWCVR